jgi:NADH-quinone oxidoreductase subunit G
LASTADLYNKKAILVIGADLALEHPFLSFQIRANYRHHQARVYVVTEKPVREDKYAAAIVRGGLAEVESLREKLVKEPELVIVFGDTAQGDGVRELVEFGTSLGIPVRYVCLVDYSNSRGAIDMGLVPDAEGMNIGEMLASSDLDALWVVGANPFEGGNTAGAPFLVVQEMFLTETAQAADVVLPASSGYEKAGTVTNVCGEAQRLKKGLQAMGTKPDLEIIGLIAKEMGLAALVGPWVPDTVFEEIRKTVHGYNIADPLIVAAQTMPVNGRDAVSNRQEPIRSSHDTLFTSGTLGRYSKALHNVMEGRKAH